MAPTTMAPNYSLFSIPAYVVVALGPHMYSATLLSKPTTGSKSGPASKTTKPPKGNMYNLANPRSSQNAATYSGSLDPATYARWERARAAHGNMLENSAFFVSAILAGIMTKLDPAYMNSMAGWYLASRVAYAVSYIAVGRGPLVLLRTVWYFAGQILLASIWYRAGLRIMSGDY